MITKHSYIAGCDVTIKPKVVFSSFEVTRVSVQPVRLDNGRPFHFNIFTDALGLHCRMPQGDRKFVVRTTVSGNSFGRSTHLFRDDSLQYRGPRRRRRSAPTTAEENWIVERYMSKHRTRKLSQNLCQRPKHCVSINR
jgi:hypothetical protein